MFLCIIYLCINLYVLYITCTQLRPVSCNNKDEEWSNNHTNWLRCGRAWRLVRSSMDQRHSWHTASSSRSTVDMRTDRHSGWSRCTVDSHGCCSWRRHRQPHLHHTLQAPPLSEAECPPADSALSEGRRLLATRGLQRHHCGLAAEEKLRQLGSDGRMTAGRNVTCSKRQWHLLSWQSLQHCIKVIKNKSNIPAKLFRTKTEEKCGMNTGYGWMQLS